MLAGIRRIFRELDQALGDLFSNSFKRWTGNYEQGQTYDLATEDGLKNAIENLRANDTTRKRQVRILFGLTTLHIFAFAAYGFSYLSQHPDDHKLHYGDNIPSTDFTNATLEQFRKLLAEFAESYNLTKV